MRNFVDLEKKNGVRNICNREFHWKKSLPFVENKRAVLTHRIRYGVTYNIHILPHVAIEFHCGMSVSTSGDNLTITDNPSDGAIICERCESMAAKRGLKTADEIVGRHVHKGKTVPVITCCKNESDA